MSMKKSLMLLGTVLLLAVILVACGGKPAEVPTTAPVAATQAPTVAAPTAAPMTIPNLDVFKTSGHANDKAEAFHHVLESRSWACNRRSSRDSHDQQPRNDGYIADRIGEEAPAFTHCGDQDAGDRRAHHPGSVEHR